MKLPDIQFGPVASGEEQGDAAVAHAIQGVTEPMAQGLTAWGQELVKTQTSNAHANAAKEFDALHKELTTRPAIPADEVERRVPPELVPADVRNAPIVKTIDPAYEQNPDDFQQAAGAPVPTVEKRADVPTWKVWEPIFKARAKEILDESSQHIEDGGWRANFRTAIQPEVVRRFSALDLHAAQQMRAELTSKADMDWQNQARAGDFAGARLLVDSHRELWGAEGEAKRHAALLGLEQLKPIDDPILHFYQDPTNPAVKDELVGAAKRLATQSLVSQIPDAHREAKEKQIRALLKSIDTGAKQHDADGLAVSIALDPQNAVDPEHPTRIDMDKALNALDAHFRAGGTHVGRPEVRVTAGTALKGLVAERNEASKQKLDKIQGDAIQQFMGMDENGTPHLAFRNLDTRTVAQLHEYGKEGETTLEQLKKWEDEFAERGRRVAQLPTQAQSFKALWLERDIAKNPGKWRGMSNGDVQAVLTGASEDPNVPPGAVSGRDLPHLSELIAKNTHPAKTQHITDPAKIAFEEAELAFPSLRANAQHPNKAPTETLKAHSLLKDKLAGYIDSHQDAQGNDPPDAEVRGEAKRLLKDDVEVQKSFMWIPYTGKTSRIEYERDNGRPPVEVPAPATAAGRPERRIAPDGRVLELGPDGKPRLVMGKDGKPLKAVNGQLPREAQ